jgi:cell division protease FtsH
LPVSPQGIIFQGPPGTGKTYLARALAGEAGVTFLSAVGSEFVEMYAGVAAARVNSLYYTAREKAPCIIFIDEIDAIGRSRSTLGGDPGSQERESALLSMLVQLDGIRGRLDNVLTIGATNLASDLDQALLRPGRFEVVYELPAPGMCGGLGRGEGGG